MPKTYHKTDKIWIAYDRKSGECLTYTAITADQAMAVMRSREPATSLQTIATHVPGKSLSTENRSWL